MDDVRKPRSLRERLFVPTDIASLVYFRIAFGILMLVEVIRYVHMGWIDKYWTEPAWNFTYFGFDWVQPWPGDGMHYHFYALGALSIFIMFGFCYRIAATLFFFGFTYVFLLEQAQYLNHFYLISLISFVMIFIPGHRAFSIDAWLRPRLRRSRVPAWHLFFLRAMIAVPYFFGGIAKLNADWLGGEPMRHWLPVDDPDLGHLFREEWIPYAFSYGGLALDLLVVPFLIWKRTRILAFGAVLFFHLSNSVLFSIGIFPWFMIGATLMFFSPDWPRRLLRRKPAPDPSPGQQSGPLAQRVTLAFVGLFLLIQILVPLRHFLYPGNVSWTEEGHNFSWHMKLRDKRASAVFYVTDPKTRRTWGVPPRKYLNRRQTRKMSTRPDMILQFAHYLAEKERKPGQGKLEVRARVWCSLNYRPAQMMVDPKVDLAAQPRTLKRKTWILPLKKSSPEPLKKRRRPRRRK